MFVSSDKDGWVRFQRLFAAHFSKVTLLTALDSSRAMDLMSYDGPIGFVMIDAGLKEEDPTELARKIIEFGGERPVIFFGRQGLLKSRVSSEIFFEHEQFDILEDPFEVERFQECIQGALEWAENEEFEDAMFTAKVEDFLEMRIKSFYLYTTFPHNVYFAVTETKFLKVIGKDKPYPPSLVNDFIRRGVRSLYIEKSELIGFYERSIEKLTPIFQDTKVKLPLAITAQARGISVIIGYIRAVGINDSVIAFSHEITASLIQTYSDNLDLRRILKEFPFKGEYLTEKSLLTAFLAFGIAHNMGWSSDIARKKFALAAILHDCALENDDMCAIISTEDPLLSSFNEKEREGFASHVERAGEYVRYYTGVTDVDFIIQQHHELPNGTGFPAGLNAIQLTSLSCIFIIAHVLAGKVVEHSASVDSLRKAVDEITLDFNQGNFKQPVKALQKLFAKF